MVDPELVGAASASGRSRPVRLRDMERMGRKAVLLESALPELGTRNAADLFR
jgi:hypothetical protein